MAETVRPGLADVPRDEYRLILADPEGPLALEDDYEAVQRRFDGKYDVSVVDINRFFPPSPSHKIPVIHKPVPKPKPVHPKVAASTVGGAIVGAVVHLLNSKGVHITHLTATEMTAISVAAAALAGYFKKSGVAS